MEAIPLRQREKRHPNGCSSLGKAAALPLPPAPPAAHGARRGSGV